MEGFTQAVTLVKQRRVDATVNDNLAVAQYTKDDPGHQRQGGRQDR